MNLVLETGARQAAYREKRDWENLGHTTRITEMRKIWKGGWQTVYRVWADKKKQGSSR